MPIAINQNVNIILYSVSSDASDMGRRGDMERLANLALKMVTPSTADFLNFSLVHEAARRKKNVCPVKSNAFIKLA